MKLVVMRHGESFGNLENYWTGWKDVPLTPLGEKQALQAGEKLKALQIPFAFCGTSLLTRAIETANIVLDECQQLFIPVEHTWRLNERHYGALVGVNKTEMIQKYGNQQVQLWRRGYYVTPPKATVEPYIDRRYQNLDLEDLPHAESIYQCGKRVLPFYNEKVVPLLKEEKNVLLVAHGNSLRGLIKYLENIPDENVKDILVPNATPVVYELNQHLQVVSKNVLS